MQLGERIRYSRNEKYKNCNKNLTADSTHLKRKQVNWKINLKEIPRMQNRQKEYKSGVKGHREQTEKV